MLIQDLLDGLADRARTIGGLVVTTDPAATVTAPMLVVADGEMTYNATMGRGSDDVNVIATLYVSKSDSKTGVARAREFKSGHGDRSLRTAFETSTGVSDPLTVAGVMVRVDTAVSGISERPDGSNYIVVNVLLLATVDGET